MKYTVIPGVILTKICDEDFLVATGRPWPRPVC